MRDLQDALEERRARKLYRRRRVSAGPQGPRQVIDGAERLSFCSNDYLGLAADPRVVEAMVAGAREWGVGAGAAHLVNGHSAAHHALEEELAEFVGRERALLFSTGYMANLGIAAALTGKGDAVIEDRLNHASMIDGGLAAGAQFMRFGHADVDALSARLERASGARRRLVMTDGVFSMDGDIAPLAAMAEVCKRHDAWLMVDDAHGLGVLGPGGRGSVAEAGLDANDVPILMGTLGKGIGCFGAFAAGDEALTETLINQARPYIYTTATPPALAEATRVALRIAREENWRRERLNTLVSRFRAGAQQLGLALMDSRTPIQPILLGEAGKALAWSARLEQAGILVTAIRPPTVPAGSARLRVTFSAAHDENDVDTLLNALEALA